MKTNWFNLREVILHDETLQTQGFAKNIQNAVEVGVTNINQTVTIYIPLCENTFNFIRFGYKYLRHVCDCRSRIQEVALHKIVGPGQLSPSEYSEEVCLNSEVYNFYTFPKIKYPDPCRLEARPINICPNSQSDIPTPCNPCEPFDNTIPINSGLPVFYSASGWMLAITSNYVDHRDKFVIGPVGLEKHSPTITEVTPFEFGAVADGIRDDYEALRKTIAFAQANNLPINLVNHTYSFSRTLEIDGPINVTGKGLILANGNLHYTNVAGTAIHVGKSRGIIPVISMDNISISGSSAIGLDLSRSVNSSFHKLSISGFDVGLRLLGSLFNNFKHCSIVGNDINVQLSGYEDGSDWVRSNDNKFWNCNLTSSKGRASLYIGDLKHSKDLAASNNAFYSCDFENFNQRGVVIDGGHGTSFIDCRFERGSLNNTDIMIYLKDFGEATRFVNCWFAISPTSTTALEVEPGHRYVRVVNTRIGQPQGAGSGNVESVLTF